MVQGIVAKVMMDKEPIFPQWFAAWHRDKDVLKASTSGGAFTAFAETILAQGGIVVGAAYDHDLNVRHEIIETPEGLKRLRGVKYVHGDIGRDIYANIEKALRNNRAVLFCGLPCQAAAIRKLFGDKDNLIIIDVVCFGAPPHVLWRKYVDWKESTRKGQHLLEINPRDKICGWGRKTYYLYKWDDGKIERQSSFYDPYAQAFYSAIAFAKACYTCKFKGRNSRADITIGDCWGVEATEVACDNIANGVNVVVVHNLKGLVHLERVRSSASFVEVKDPSALLAENLPINHNAVCHKQWASFQVDLKTLSFSRLIRKYKLQNSKLRQVYCRSRGIVAKLIKGCWFR